jgi:hypothetical protein
MTNGRGGSKSGRGGRGNSGRGGGRGGRGQNYTSASNTVKKGLCSNLGGNVFDYGQNNSADQMRTSWEKLTQYVGITYGLDICNELTNKAQVTLSEPAHTQAVMDRHKLRDAMVRSAQRNMKAARESQLSILEAKVATDASDLQAIMDVVVLKNQLASDAYDALIEVPIDLTDTEKTHYSNEWRTFRDRNAALLKHRGQAYSLLLGQCTQLLQDKLKQETEWTTVSTGYDPLSLYRLIEKTTLSQTEDQYPFATIYDVEKSFYGFRQQELSNPQWYERYNTKVDVGVAIGVTRQHKVLLEYVAMEVHNTKFDTLSDANKDAVRIDAEERYISYAFLRQSGAQHAKLKTDLQNDFTIGDNRYPKNRQQTLHLLDK